MIQLVDDIHTHTIAGGHACGTIREMTQAAAEKRQNKRRITPHGAFEDQF